MILFGIGPDVCSEVAVLRYWTETSTTGSDFINHERTRAPSVKEFIIV